MKTADSLDTDGRIPVAFDVVEGPAHAVAIGAAYSTDLGANLTASWSDRNLFGNAEQLNLTAGVQGGGTAIKGPANYFTAQFVKPDFLDRNQSLQIDLSAVRQNLLAYFQKGVSADVLVKRTFWTNWSGSIGISGEAENITQQDVARDYTLVGLPIAVRYDSTNSLLDPTSGVRAAATTGRDNEYWPTYADEFWPTPGVFDLLSRAEAGLSRSASLFHPLLHVLPPFRCAVVRRNR